MRRVHVLLEKEALDPARLRDQVVVVLDVLFATSSIVTALAHGATEVVPTLDGDAARAEAGRRPVGSYLLSGEKDAVTLPGFAHPTPLALLEQPLAGRSLIYSTTNGTVALLRARGAARVLAGALLNAEAVAGALATADGTALLVCAGSAGAFNLEDFYGAGLVVSLLSGHGPLELNDAAEAARLLCERAAPLDCLSRGRVGRMMVERGWTRELEFAAQTSRFALVPELLDGRLIPAARS
jgi:2-phosphosulfolactate phosphatase